MKILGQLFSILLLTATLGMAGAVSAENEAIIIDVRTPGEYTEGHLEGALNLPHTQIAGLIGEHDIDRDRPIEVYCASGRRSGIAKETLEDMGYTRVKNIGAYDDLKEERETSE